MPLMRCKSLRTRCAAGNFWPERGRAVDNLISVVVVGLAGAGVIESPSLTNVFWGLVAVVVVAAVRLASRV